MIACICNCWRDGVKEAQVLVESLLYFVNFLYNYFIFLEIFDIMC